MNAKKLPEGLSERTRREIMAGHIMVYRNRFFDYDSGKLSDADKAKLRAWVMAFVPPNWKENG